MYQFFIMHSGMCSVFIFGGVSLLYQFLVAIALNCYVKASANMKTTRKKVLVNLKNQFETIYGMDYKVSNVEAYVEKYLLKLKFVGTPYSFLEHSSILPAGLVTLLAGGEAFYYYVINASVQMYVELLFAYGITLVCFFVFFHIFGIKNKKTQIQIQLVDYLENYLANRLARTRREESFSNVFEEEIKREPSEDECFFEKKEEENVVDPESAESDMEMLRRLVREMEEKNSKSKRTDIAMTEVAMADDDPNLELLEEFVQSFLA